ncbi:hypothetical protein GGE16_005800 [Rhizobium leguminosarum]|uniref:Integrase n=1 Tax=Rhizobium leguminosarum TaxID=384 RepID=A0AAE2MQP6_RHILE|nr:hypothetical protein [Rhizobium leguminosarum]MBB4435186.1 hypothetical protein [Rhizobium esperanzae]MBB4299306.1 hypothetical protein [Rhizobium leguminosarum]MBB4310805.1 hypothetical protein [Rhizobium leguminosarum]MBB4420083.1 hypothetical protein [Rhizobium leguminosarum]
MVYLTGRPVEALDASITAAKIESGSVFRGIGRQGTVSRRAIDPQSVNAILKQRAELAGLDSGEFSAHGLRSGYLTDPSTRHQATTTMPRVEVGGPPVCSKRAGLWPSSVKGVFTMVISRIEVSQGVLRSELCPLRALLDIHH